MEQGMRKTSDAGNPLGYAPIIGHVVGMLGNAATNVAFPVVTLTTAFAQLIGVGTASNFNISLGAGREEEAR